jgi:hypothetical protein
MSLKLTITVSRSDEAGVSRQDDLRERGTRSGGVEHLRHRLDELVNQAGDQIGPFPDAGVDGFLSHFEITLELLQDREEGRVITFSMPPSTQSVSRSEPFIYEGRKASHRVTLPLPSECTLPDTIEEADFVERPHEFFEPGKETVWMQILNLDARADVPELGPIRILIGETLKQEYPDIFRPSHGVAQSLGRSGFPARLFFNPYAVIETQIGAFRAVHGTLAYGRITEFPPIGTPVTIREMEPLLPVEEVRKAFEAGTPETAVRPAARLLALAHPIDAALRIPGEEAFRLVERGARVGLG